MVKCLLSIQLFFTAENLVIGLRKIMEGTNDFRWDDETPLEYKNWAEGRPNFSGNCVVMKGADWFDDNCLDKMQYVCQRSTGDVFNNRFHNGK